MHLSRLLGVQTGYERLCVGRIKNKLGRFFRRVITLSLPQNHTSTSSSSVVLFDGVCNFCNASVNFVIDRDSKGHFKFASLQSDVAASYLAACSSEDMSGGAMESIVLVEDGVCYEQSTAVLRIARKMDGLWPLLWGFVVVPRSLRDVAYNWIARNRYRWFGKQDTCRIPTPELRTRFVE